MTPAWHSLGDPRIVHGWYTATCQCGLDVYGRTLPAMWTHHDAHLGVVRQQSLRNHPSRRRRP